MLSIRCERTQGEPIMAIHPSPILPCEAVLARRITYCHSKIETISHRTQEQLICCHALPQCRYGTRVNSRRAANFRFRASYDSDLG